MHLRVINANKFGFKAGHSTSLCAGTVKKVIYYYTAKGSHVFACFVDLSKAFDRVIIGSSSISFSAMVLTFTSSNY